MITKETKALVSKFDTFWEGILPDVEKLFPGKVYEVSIIALHAFARGAVEARKITQHMKNENS